MNSHEMTSRDLNSREPLQSSDLPLSYNAVAILDANLATRADKVALYSDARQMTFQAVADEVNQVGHALTRLGVGFGDCVGILAPDCAEWVTAFFGTIKIGAIAMGLNTLLQTHEYEYILRDSRARVLLVHESLLSVIEPLRNQPSILPQVIVIGSAQHPEDLTFDTWLAPEATRLVAAPTHRDDFCSLHYTSGTTGQPKGLFHAHKDYPLIAHNTGVALLGLTEADRTFAVAKLFFVYGLGGNLIMPWYVGASIVLYDGAPRSAGAILEMIDRFQPTVLLSVPTAYINTLTLRNLTDRYDLTSLRLCLSAGEALPAPIWQRWQEQTGLAILDTVGCTESLHTFLANRPDDLRPGSSGKPSPGYTVKLVDDDGQPVAPGEIGNLLVKGDSVALFYLHQFERSRHTFRGEWLFTGDKYYQDEAGFYWHAGRSDDMFKVGGLWVSPVEVESVLTGDPAVLECAVVGAPEQNELIKPKAFVRLKPDETPSPDILRRLLHHCAAQLPAHKCPRWLEFVEDLPKTATGKIQRFKLRG